MSVETSSEQSSAPQTAPAYQQPPASGSAKKWIACCGIGCFGMFVLCAGGSIFVYLSAPDQFSQMFQIMRDSQSAAVAFSESDVVKEKLGDSIEQASFWPQFEQLKDGETHITRTKVKFKGSDGEGFFVTEIRMNTETGEQESENYLEFEGEKYEIADPTEEFELDIDDPSEELEEPGVDETDSEIDDSESDESDESTKYDAEKAESGASS